MSWRQNNAFTWQKDLYSQCSCKIQGRYPCTRAQVVFMVLHKHKDNGVIEQKRAVNSIFPFCSLLFAFIPKYLKFVFGMFQSKYPCVTLNCVYRTNASFECKLDSISIQKKWKLKKCLSNPQRILQMKFLHESSKANKYLLSFRERIRNRKGLWRLMEHLQTRKHFSQLFHNRTGNIEHF